MKKFMNKVGAVLLNAKTRVGYCGLVAANAMTTIHAKASGGSLGGDKAQGENIVRTAIDTIVQIFPWVGAFFVVSGAFKLVMAYRGENPEAQTAAAKDIVIGAVLIIFKAFIWDIIAKAIWG